MNIINLNICSVQFKIKVYFPAKIIKSILFGIFPWLAGRCPRIEFYPNRSPPKAAYCSSRQNAVYAWLTSLKYTERLCSPHFVIKCTIDFLLEVPYGSNFEGKTQSCFGINRQNCYFGSRCYTLIFCVNGNFISVRQIHLSEIM